MTRTFLVGVQLTGPDLPTEQEVEAILARGSVQAAFAGPDRTVHLRLLTWPDVEWTVEEILEREG